MAASMWMRCVTAAVKVKCFSPSNTVRRCLLSAAYTDTKVWEAREIEPQNIAQLADLMDRTYDGKLPVSSLTMARFVDNITSDEQVDQTEYYLYKFRHSPNCWYLKDWTIHSWVRQCLKYAKRDKALHTLKNKVQYGIFPDSFTFNLLIDSYIKDEDYKSACAVVEEVMLQEAFDLPSTKILSLYALSHYLETDPQLLVSEVRSLGASLFVCGRPMEDTIGLSAQLLGNALLGKVEMLSGIHAVFRGFPLHWAHGYLDRALAVMEKVAAGTGDAKLTNDALERVAGVLGELGESELNSSGSESSGAENEVEELLQAQSVDEDDEAERARLPEYVARFKELRGRLESEGKVEASSFQALVGALAEKELLAAEAPDVEQYQQQVQAWETERLQLLQREKEHKEKALLVQRGIQMKRRRAAAKAKAKAAAAETAASAAAAAQ